MHLVNMYLRGAGKCSVTHLSEPHTVTLGATGCTPAGHTQVYRCWCPGSVPAGQGTGGVGGSGRDNSPPYTHTHTLSSATLVLTAGASCPPDAVHGPRGLRDPRDEAAAPVHPAAAAALCTGRPFQHCAAPATHAKYLCVARFPRPSWFFLFLIFSSLATVPKHTLEATFGTLCRSESLQAARKTCLRAKRASLPHCLLLQVHLRH